MLLVGGLQEQLGRVRGSAGDDDDVARETLLAPVAVDDDLGDGRPVGVRLEPDDPRVREQRDVRMLEGRPNAEHLGVGLGVNETREPVARPHSGYTC